MYLYLIRHGEAVTEQVDPERHLSEQGMLDVSEMAAFMAMAEIEVEEIWHSTKERARQTAKIIAGAISHNNVIERPGLAPNDPILPLAEEVNSLHENILVAGHLPFLERLASYLLTADEKKEAIHFKEGGVVCLVRVGAGWSLAWMLTPQLLSRCMRQE